MFKKALKIISILLVAFFITEIFANSILPKSNIEYKVDTSLNNTKLHDVDHLIEKPKNTFRILLLGGSFVVNNSVPLKNSFFRELQGNIPNENGKKIEIITLGSENATQNDELSALQNQGLAYKPDLVIQFLQTDRDIINNSSVLQKYKFVPYTSTILSKFKTGQLFINIKNQIDKNSADNTFGYPLKYHIYDLNYTTDMQNAWDNTYDMILKTKTATENAGGKYLLMTLVNKEQIDLKFWNNLVNSTQSFRLAKLDISKPEELVSDFCEEQEVDCWQMIPFFLNYIRAHPNDRLLYNDESLTQTGTDLVANTLTTSLKSYFNPIK
jgi:hypothetical protein